MKKSDLSLFSNRSKSRERIKNFSNTQQVCKVNSDLTNYTSNGKSTSKLANKRYSQNQDLNENQENMNINIMITD